MKGSGWTARGLRIRANVLLALAMVIVLAGICAGLAAQGWPGFLAVAVAFCVARMLERPWLVSRIAQPGGVLAFSQGLAVQVTLALALYWTGFGVSVLTGWQPPLPLWLPASVVVAAALLSRMIWRPMPPEWDSFLDEATGTLTKMTAEMEAITPPGPAQEPEKAPDGWRRTEQDGKDRE